MFNSLYVENPDNCMTMKLQNEEMFYAVYAENPDNYK